MLKKILAPLKEYKYKAILSIILDSIQVAFVYLVSYLVARLIDKGLMQNNMNEVAIYSVAILVSTILTFVLDFITIKLKALISSGYEKNLRKMIFDKIQGFTFKNIDKFKIGSLITRSSKDVETITNGVKFGLNLFVRGILLMIINIIFGVMLSKRMIPIYLGIIIALLFIFFILIKIAIPVIIKINKKYDKLNEVNLENLSNVRDIKSFVLEDYEKIKHEKISKDVYKSNLKANRIAGMVDPLFSAVVAIADYAMYILIGSSIIFNLGSTIGDLTALRSYIISFSAGLMFIAMMFLTFNRSIDSAKRIVEIFDEEIDIVEDQNPVEKMKKYDIKFENVNFSYVNKKDKLCLKNIDLEIKEAETIGIIGGVGSGKTTLISLISRLYDITSGTLKIGGIDIQKYSISELRKNIGVVLQKNTVLKGTISENIRMGNENASDKEIKEALRIASADTFVNKFDKKYEYEIEENGANLSGGQKQRLCIARAVIKKPKILILDDSTSAIDTKTDSKIQSEFRKYIPKTTKIIISQRISSIKDADKIIVMDNGRINQIGKHGDLLKTNKIYAEIYNSQKGGENEER